MVYGEMRRAIEGAEICRLPEVASAMWKAYGAGGLTDAEVEQLAGLLEARQGAARAAPERPSLAQAAERVAAVARARARAGSRPRSAESLGRRRRWAAAGFLPPALAAGFTQGEVAALAVVAGEIGKRGTCALALGAIAALAGVSESTAKRALRQARGLGLVSIEERRLSRERNDTHLVRIVSREWAGWLRLRMPRPGRPPLSPPGVQAGSSPNITGPGIARKWGSAAGFGSPTDPENRGRPRSRIVTA